MKQLLTRQAAFLAGLPMLAAFLVPTQIHATEGFAPKYVNDVTEICVERRENDGILNIIPVTLIVSRAVKLTLLGGQAGCLYIPAGQQTIQLSFPYPFSGSRSQRNWITAPKAFRAAKGSNTTFELCVAPNQNINDARWIQTGWHDMWQLHPATGAARCPSN